MKMNEEMNDKIRKKVSREPKDKAIDQQQIRGKGKPRRPWENELGIPKGQIYLSILLQLPLSWNQDAFYYLY